MTCKMVVCDHLLFVFLHHKCVLVFPSFVCRRLSEETYLEWFVTSCCCSAGGDQLRNKTMIEIFVEETWQNYVINKGLSPSDREVR